MKKKPKKPAAKNKPKVNWRAPRDPKPGEVIAISMPFTTSHEQAMEFARKMLRSRKPHTP